MPENEVHDVPAERGIKLNNVLTGGILAVMIGAAGMLWEVKETVHKIAGTQLVIENRLATNEKIIFDHEGRIRIIEHNAKP